MKKNVFILSSIFILIIGFYKNMYDIIKYIFIINLGYFILKYILPLLLKKYKIENKLNKTKICKVSQLNLDGLENSIYLTQFKVSGYVLYLYHFIFGYYNYYFDFINLFCLIISFFQIYDYGEYKSFIPLCIFSTLYSLYYTFNVSKLIKEQNNINQTNISKIKKGDIIDLKLNLKSNNIIPADILILNDNMYVATNELQLSGENIIINKLGIIGVNNYNKENLLNSTIFYNNNVGYIEYLNKKYHFNKNNIIFRGTELVDGELLGLVIEVGNNCMIYNIDNKIIKEKTKLYKKVNNITFDNLYYLLILACILSGGLKMVYPNYNLLFLIKTIVLLFNTIVPLSLQSFYNTSTWLLSNKIEKEEKVKINNHGLHCFQNLPKYIVTDKTGTITKNKLKLHQIINIKKNNNINNNDNVNNNNINVLDITNKLDINLFKDVMACTLINIHSITKKLIKNDELEYLLLNKYDNIELISNNYNDNNINSSYYEYKLNDNIFRVQKMYYKPFDYTLGIKYSIVKDENKYILNIQGTPEAINSYSNNLVNISEKYMSQISENNYRRIICYSKKIITEDEYYKFKLDGNINNLLNDFDYVNIYIFEDEVVENLNNDFANLLNDGKNLTILTGDRLSSSIEIGKILNLCDNMIVLEKVGDLNINLDIFQTFIINGKLLIELINNHNDILKHIIYKKNKIIIYRATPLIKEKYIQYIKFIDLDNQVLMIGDGSNDIAAIMKADVGIGVIGESLQVQNISDIIIDNWSKIPNLLKNFKIKKNIIEHIIKWTISKHIFTATNLLTILLNSNFKIIKDHTNPLHMLIFNSILYCYMILFCYNGWRIIYNQINNKKYFNIIYETFYISFIIGFIIFNVFNIDIGIKISLLIQLVYALLKL